MSEEHPVGRPVRLLERLPFVASAAAMRAETWRRDVLELGLKVCAVLGSVVYVPSVWAAVRFEKWGVATVDTGALAAIVLLACIRSLGFAARSVAFALVLYALGVALLVEVGPVSQIYLFGFSVIATLLLGVRVGVLTVGLSAVSLLVIGLAGPGAPEMGVRWHPVNPAGWVVTTMNFALVNITLVLTVGAVLAALERAVRQEHAAREQLERERAELVATNAALDRQMGERARLEDQLVRAGRMEAVGQLAGGIAHDFNNLLTVINGYSELLVGNLPADDPNRALAAEIGKAGARSAELTRQLLAFSRKQVLAPRALDLNAVVRNAASLLRRVIGEDMSLGTDLASGLWAVRADPGQLEQVLMNLAVNARDAMPAGGRLTIATRNCEGAFVELAVSDTGTGMTDEVKARVFEPFFTTKGPGQGTGLGLATVFGIVQQSGGTVQVDTILGAGTVFRVSLPRTSEFPALDPGHDPGVGPRGSETVLLVEDETGVRGLAQRVLRGYGYTVLETSSGAAALATTDRHAAPIHLLLTDVVMSGLNGRELAERVRSRRPGVRVLFMSGYTDDAVVRHGVRCAQVNFIQKPFTPVALALKVREVLDATGADVRTEG